MSLAGLADTTHSPSALPYEQELFSSQLRMRFFHFISRDQIVARDGLLFYFLSYICEVRLSVLTRFLPGNPSPHFLYFWFLYVWFRHSRTACTRDVCVVHRPHLSASKYPLFSAPWICYHAYVLARMCSSSVSDFSGPVR
jgi:hypothetical protein